MRRNKKFPNFKFRVFLEPTWTHTNVKLWEKSTKINSFYLIYLKHDTHIIVIVEKDRVNRHKKQHYFPQWASMNNYDMNFKLLVKFCETCLESIPLHLWFDVISQFTLIPNQKSVNDRIGRRPVPRNLAVNHLNEMCNDIKMSSVESRGTFLWEMTQFFLLSSYF